MGKTCDIGNQIHLVSNIIRISMISKVLPIIGEVKRFEVFHNPVDTVQYYEIKLNR